MTSGTPQTEGYGGQRIALRQKDMELEEPYISKGTYIKEYNSRWESTGASGEFP